jgi:hypothetical protein
MLMGMGDVSKSVVPKIALLSAPRKGGVIASRYFVPDTCHKSHPVTGTVCIASACAIPGTVAAQIASLPPAPHPSGLIIIDLDADLAGGRQELRRAALVRTARRIFEGHVCIPEAIWPGFKRSGRAAVATA